MIKPTTVLEDTSKKILNTEYVNEFRYESTDSSIATVDADGKITAVSKDTCYIRVFAINGVSAQVKVKVK